MKRLILNTGSPVTVLFSPHAGIFPPSTLDDEVARLLQRDHENILKITCSGQLNHWCPVMTAAKLRIDSDSAKRRAVCSSCKGISKIQSLSSITKEIDLSELLSAENELDVASMVDSINEENWRDFTYEGLPLGAWSAYNAMIDFKSPSPSARPDAFLRYKADLGGALKSAIAARNLSQQTNIAEALAHSFEYSSPRAFLGVLSRLGVSTFSFYGDGHREFRHRLLTVAPAKKFPDLRIDVRYRRGLEDALTKHEIALVRSHLEGIIQGKGELEYSPPPTKRDLRSSLRIADFQKSVLVLTSSPDEVEASLIAGLRPDHLSQDNDIEFIQNVISLAKSNPQTNFIIRVHPRLSPNRRDSETSYVLSEIRKLESNAPENVTWNFPEDGHSLYDLLPIIDFVIAYRSSAAHEAMALGYRCFFVDPTKDPTQQLSVAFADAAEVPSRFSSFLSTLDKPFSPVLVWRFLATDLLRVRIDVDNQYEFRAPRFGNSREQIGSPRNQKSLWQSVKNLISPSQVVILNFLLWSWRILHNKHKAQVREVSIQNISLGDMTSVYKLWGSQLDKGTERKMVAAASAELLSSLQPLDRQGLRSKQ